MDERRHARSGVEVLEPGDVPPDGIPPGDGIDEVPSDGIPPHLVRSVSAEEVLGFSIDDAEATQLLANRLAARQLFAIHEAFEIAREHPRIYVPVGASDIPGVKDIDFAERSVAFDLAQRLHLSENLVRDYDHQARVLNTALPRVRELFLDGAIGQRHVRAAVESADGIDDGLLGRYDERLAAIGPGLRPDMFARRCRLLRERLCVDTLQERHDREHLRRRVVIEPAADGMAWINAYVPAIDAARIDQRLAATATRMGNEPGERRTKEQLRADALIAWLSGDGTPTAASVRPFVLIGDSGRFAELLGYGPIDPRSAAAALRDAPSFRRVTHDPIRPARLVLDKGQYRPSADQRTWLRLNFGLDDDAAPFVSPDAEVDHVMEYQHGGITDVANLVPLKPRLHRLKSATRIRLDPKPRGGIRVRTPTGYDSDPPPF